MYQAASRGEPTKSRTRHHRCYCRYANTPSHIRSYSHIHAVSIQCRGCQPGSHDVIECALENRLVILITFDDPPEIQTGISTSGL